MKVAVVCPYDLGRFGGVQDQAEKLTGWLQEAGHEAWLVGPGTEGPAGARLVGPVTVVTANGAATPITLRPASWKATAEAVAGADVIHIHEPFMPIVSQAAAAVDGVAKVGTFHADPSRAVRRLYRIGGPLLRRIARKLTLATAVSPVAAAPLAGLVDVRLVPNGIDTSDYVVGKKVPRSVAFVGRDDPRKGLDVLLQAWPEVLRQVPDAELVVAGAETRSDASSGVSFLGVIDEEAKRDLLATTSVFCAPNTGGESFGIVLAEAMAAGCAVVASAVPAFVHVLGEAGALAKPADSAGLAHTLVRALSDASYREALSAAALERVKSFDRAAVLGAYVRVFEEAIALGPRRTARGTGTAGPVH
jgi:phosphatidylinositol alpha-mannosyltransferase